MELSPSKSWTEFTPEEIRDVTCFPTNLWPIRFRRMPTCCSRRSWLAVHPEHRRIDVDMDIPDEYLPEFPPPLFLTTHKELGDVSNGQEITLDNYYEIFDGLLHPNRWKA